MDLVSKYIGPKEDTKVKINRLGSGDWQKTKAKVRASVRDMAKELIALYAKRMSTPGYAFSPDGDMQRDFELRFAYDETDDQLQSAAEIKADMERPSPMDRLLCGDVGFGKTEVALRSAFKCIADGKQCAILVPTTVLAMQHYQTAMRRMEPFPVRVEMLSRFVSPTKQKQILEELAHGGVDLLVGTHRIISKDIRFKDLGLLIVDEEQRFGVAQKEKIKEKFPAVDVLTLSATPIPRTLNMAMSGIRDMSVISQPPQDRYPVQTYVMEYSEPVLVQAIQRELKRGGQVYYIHNRIDTIEFTAAKLQRYLPDARILVAHGRMGEVEMSEIWRKLVEHEADILVCTTIIETGVDVPNVNTLIIENADCFGLSQLYQLRGRVGRSNRSAYAFLLYKRDKMIKEVAEKRLKAIREFTDLGSGYKIAMKDLEIRGAGNLLGQEQSGNIEAVGYDLYCQMLNDAIRRLSGETVREEFVTNVELPLNAYIPDSYVKNEYVKLDLYKRISKCANREDNDAILEEVRDRFGEPPKPFFRLLDVAYLKAIAHEVYITDIKYVGDEVRFYMLPQAPVQAERVNPLLKRYKNTLRLTAGKQTYFRIRMSKLIEEEMVSSCEKVIEDIRTLYNTEDVNHEA